MTCFKNYLLVGMVNNPFYVNLSIKIPASELNGLLHLLF